MPGTIQISVLEFKGLPAESCPSLLKVSLGKREYQTSDMNEFSFPLTTLRDDLVVALHDAEGNKLAHLGIRTMSIVEKVSWDDIFPLEGGGYLHLKLKFMLSQQEQTRIRAMREAALKEKKGTIQAGSLSNPGILHDIRQPDFSEEGRSILIKEIPKDNGDTEKAGSDPSRQEAETRPVKKIDTQSLIHPTLLKSVSSEEASSMESSSDSLNLKKDLSREKNVSKVKVIAKAFESGPTKDVKFPLNPSAVKPGEKKVPKEGSTDSVEERNSSSGFVAEGSKPGNEGVNDKISAERSVDDVESQATVRSKQSTSLVTDPRADNIHIEEKGMSTANSDTLSTSETATNHGTEQSPSVVIDPTVDDMNREETRMSTGYSDSDRALTSKTASTPGKKLDCNSENAHLFDLSAKKHYKDSSNAEEKGRKDPYATKFNPSNEESIPLEYREEDIFLRDKSGMCTFFGDRKYSCAIPAGKRVVDLIGSLHAEAKPYQDENISNILEDPIKFVQHGTDEEKETDSKESEDTKKSIPESPSNDAWNGLVAQAMKFALVVGFGVLVFLTRQKQPRKTSKNEPGLHIFKPSEYMNDQVFEAEKWID